MIVIHTQQYENYGAHTWEGKGECPQRWKAKGGSCYKITNEPKGLEDQETAIYLLAQLVIGGRNDYYEETVLGVSFESDEWLSPFEQSQLEYEGSIVYKEPTMTYDDFLGKKPN
jgi:hypothetical protein